jgi:antitoxin (DNA-binding transcriptional repressor) of toxin-antitoxin stability system
MEMFTIRDLRNRTGELIREAEAGHLSLVTKHGHCAARDIFLSEQLIADILELAHE